MSIKERLYKLAVAYFALVTLISAAVYILGSSFDPDASFGYDVLLAPFRYAALGIIPRAVMLSKKELAPTEYIIRKILQLIIVEAEFIALGVASPNIRNDTVIYLCLSVLVIFIAVNAVTMLSGWITAKRLTSDLAAFQESISDN